MSEWDIKRPIGQCCGTGETIDEGAEYYAALVETPEGLERRDFCEEFWQENKPVVYCYWKTKFVPAQQKRQLFIDEDMLMAFFERLEADSDSERVNFRFVLALVLMRKRRLKYDSSRTEGDNEIWLLRVTGEKRIVQVVNPRLTEQEIEQLSCQLGEILQVQM